MENNLNHYADKEKYDNQTRLVIAGIVTDLQNDPYNPRKVLQVADKIMEFMSQRKKPSQKPARRLNE